MGVAPRVYIVRKENKRKKGGEREKGIDSHAVHMCQVWCVSMLMSSGILPQGVVSMFMPGTLSVRSEATRTALGVRVW